MRKWRPSPGRPWTAAWVPSIRLVAVPFALAEVAIERGSYPAGHEPWAWALALTFALGAVALFLRRGAPAALALAFDLAIVSGFVCLYAYEPASPVRQLFVLTAVEAGLVLGARAGAVAALASVPALAIFEWRASDRLGASYDPGHVLGPLGIQVLVGLVVGALAMREPAR